MKVVLCFLLLIAFASFSEGTGWGGWRSSGWNRGGSSGWKTVRVVKVVPTYRSSGWYYSNPWKSPSAWNSGWRSAWW